jgi:hypothetical protein
MKSVGKNIVALVILAMIFLTFSGCLSKQNGNSTDIIHPAQQSSAIPPPKTTSEKYWIRIDPIADYKTDSTFNITGSTHITVKGTTNFPAATPMRLTILEEDRSRDLVKTELEIKSNNSGPNSFSYEYDLIGNPPGRYRAVLTNSTNPPSAVSRFNITSDTPYFKWIRIDPLGEEQSDGIIPISGTTDLPAGVEIMIGSDIVAHSCPSPSPTLNEKGPKTLCNGGCQGAESKHTILVMEGMGGINKWNSTIDTSGWCVTEDYSIAAEAINWTNVTLGSQSIRVHSQ